MQGVKADIDASLLLGNGLPAPRRLMFLAPRQAAFQSLCRAIADHFGMSEVRLLEHLPASHLDEGPVDLLLLAVGLAVPIDTLIFRCHERYPRASIILVAEGASSSFERFVDRGSAVQGLLQTSLPLEVWFAVIQLVLAGGEFRFSNCTERFERQRERFHSPASPVEAWEASPRNEHGDVSALSMLTAREREILMWISEGYQNKLIANRMALSEHTVKAHVHNLIVKLHVTNRTQAAAYLYEHRPEARPADRRHHLDEPGSD